MTEPVKTINIGGVTYLEGQVKNSSINDEIYTDASGNLKSKSLFNVELSDGTKLTYREQTPEREAVVLQEGNWTKFFGLDHAQIKDTPNNDKYELSGCNWCMVKAQRSHSEGIIFKEEVGEDKDQIIIKHRKMTDGSVQASTYNHTSLNDGDYYTDKTKDTGDYKNYRFKR